MSQLQLVIAIVVVPVTLIYALVALRSHQRKRRARHRAPDSVLRNAVTVSPVLGIALVTAAGPSFASRPSPKVPITTELVTLPTTAPSDVPALPDELPALPQASSALQQPTTPPPTLRADHTSAPRTHSPSRVGTRRLPLAIPPTVVGTFRARVVRAVHDVIGTPYHSGSESPSDGFDCSGLTMWAYGRAGIRLPRVADDQMRSMTSVRIPTPGDLVFFLDGGGYAYHAGVYIAPDLMIAAPKTGDRVRIEKIWTDRVSYRAAVV